MTSWNLSDIRQKVRQITGRFSSNDISNTELDDRINKYYQFTFPSEVKLETKHTYYEFMTTTKQVYYDIPSSTYTNYEPPVTANNLSMLWYQNPNDFFEQNPLQYTFLNPWTGDGSTVTFTTTITGYPIFPGKLTISDEVELFEDTNDDWTTSNVSITGSLAGSATINYSTGAISVTFNTAPTNGQLIHLNYVIFNPGRPQAMLYYNNQFQLFPAPDQPYKIKMKAYKIVTALINATDTPELNEWGPCIAFGTAKELFADYGEMQSYSEALTLHREQISHILTRTAQDLMNVRSQPSF